MLNKTFERGFSLEFPFSHLHNGLVQALQEQRQEEIQEQRKEEIY